MQTPESSFHAWILTGNALNLLLRGVPAESFANASMRDHLIRLEEELKESTPEETLTRLHALPQDDRKLLAIACRQAMLLAGENMESMLGLTTQEAEAVLRILTHAAG